MAVDDGPQTRAPLVDECGNFCIRMQEPDLRRAVNKLASREMASNSDHLVNKRWLHNVLRLLADASGVGISEVLSEVAAPDCRWRMPHPIHEVSGTRAMTAFLATMKAAFPDLERRDLIFAGGDFQGSDFVAAMGHYCGVFARDWLGIPASGRPVWLRYGEVYRIKAGRVIEVSCLWDLLDLIRQAGHWPLAPSLGVETMWSGPITGNGVLLASTDHVEGRKNLQQTLAMHAALGAYDDRTGAGRDGLLVMPQRDFWHPRMMWYGPAGIGTTRGLAGFVDRHQLPFRTAFPNRKGGSQWNEIEEERQRLGGGHYIRIGDGPISVTGGWPSVFAQHTGGGFLGQAPTGRIVTMRVMDFYLHDEGLIRENWVPIDILDALFQVGFDVLGRLAEQISGRCGV